MQVQCQELRRCRSVELTAVGRPDRHPMVEAEAAILRLFSKRGRTGGYLRPRLVALATGRGRLSVLIPPSGSPDAKYGCVVRSRTLTRHWLLR